MRYITATITVVLFFAVFACSHQKPSEKGGGHTKIQFEPAKELQIKAVMTETEVDSLLNSI